MDAKRKNLKLNARIFILGIIFMTTLSLLLIDSNKLFRSTISVMLIPRSQEVASHIDDISANAQELPKTLAFFEKMLSDNPGVNDFTRGKTPDERKKLWNKYITVSQAKGGSETIIEISLYAKKQSDAEALSKKTAQTLFSVMSGYYNVKSELDMRVIDGPISSVAVNDLWWIISVSAAIGFLIAFLVHSITEKIFAFGFALKSRTLQNRLVDMTHTDFSPSASVPSSIEDLYLPEELAAVQNAEKASEEIAQPQEAAAASISSEEMRKMQYPDFPEMPMGHNGGMGRESVAPDNLPVFDGASFQFGAPKEDQVEPKKESCESSYQTEPVKHHEPTQEEIKKRLNALLSGKI